MQLVRVGGTGRADEEYRVQDGPLGQKLHLGTGELLDVLANALEHRFRVVGLEVLDGRQLSLGSSRQDQMQQELLGVLRETGVDGLTAVLDSRRPSLSLGAVNLVDPQGRSLRLTRSGVVDASRPEAVTSAVQLISASLRPAW